MNINIDLVAFHALCKCSKQRCSVCAPLPRACRITSCAFGHSISDTLRNSAHDLTRLEGAGLSAAPRVLFACQGFGCKADNAAVGNIGAMLHGSRCDTQHKSKHVPPYDTQQLQHRPVIHSACCCLRVHTRHAAVRASTFYIQHNRVRAVPEARVLPTCASR